MHVRLGPSANDEAKGKCMLKGVCRTFVVACAVLLFSACATQQPVMNVTEAPIVSNKANPSPDEIRQAIVRAGAQLGWQMRPERPGHIMGTLALRTHLAVVDIEYDRKSYSIK